MVTPVGVLGTVPPTLTATQAPIQKPTFVLAFVPVQWDGSDTEFEDEVNNDVSFFISASGIDNYFQVETHIIWGDNSLDATNSDTIIDDLVSYGLSNYPADRYIGITGVDLVLYGDNSVIGWTMGDNSMGTIIEKSEVEVLAHELGHTFGLCDEYSLDAWNEQNAELSGGCPNPLRRSCTRSSQMCEGVPTDDGKNSIMGPGGMYGPYGFNTASYNALQERFQRLAESAGQ